MDWKTFGMAFMTLFLAEMGDKTQLACIMMAGKTGKPVAVFLGASLALVCVTLIAVLFSAFITQYIPVNIMKKTAAGAFVLLGLLMFFDIF